MNIRLDCGAPWRRKRACGSHLATIPRLEMYRQLFSGSFSQLKERNSFAVELQEVRKEQQAAQRRERLARLEKERAENAARAANQRARAEEERAAAETHRMRQLLWHASFAPPSPPMYDAYPMSYGSYRRAPPAYGSYNRAPRRAYGGGGRRRLRFYAGGQFIPGGGHAPAGGIWM